MEALVKFTLLLRDQQAFLVDRYSERKETAEGAAAWAVKKAEQWSRGASHNTEPTAFRRHPC